MPSSSNDIASGLTKLYREDFLLKKVAVAALDKMDNHDLFAEYLLTQFNNLDRSLRLSENIVVDHAKFQDGWRPSGEFIGGENTSLSGLRQVYEENFEYDIFSPKIFEHQGNVVGYSDLQPYDFWRREKLQQIILAKFGVKDVTGVAFPRPLHKGEVVAFYFLREKEWPLCENISKDQLVAFLLPFYFCWIFRFGWIDREHLIEALKSISGRTPKQLRALRTVAAVNSLCTDYLGSIYASNPNDPKASYNSLYRILDRVLNDDGETPEGRSPDGYLSLKCRDRFKLLGYSGVSSGVVDRRLSAEKEERLKNETLLSDSHIT